MGSNVPEKYKTLIKDDKRIDGRKLDELRPVKIEVGVIPSASGSAYIEIGNTKVLAAVHGPKEMFPRHMIDEDKAVLNVRYAMLPFSTSDRVRPGPSRRSNEISKVTRHALESVICLEEYPAMGIDLTLDIIQADAGTRATAITAASVALAHAGIPMKGLVAATAIGKINDKLAVDLNGPEDNFGQTDMPIAMISTNKNITLLQMDGDFSKEEFKTALSMAKKAIGPLFEAQKAALRKYYE
ncbi:MAG: exosome complex exonuclease Rrp41 [Nanohaloarchaea archaeon]|nr:exosome complex exonuclease Rrp41 [Candidatus Nanohaloarchaea archaeon]